MKRSSKGRSNKVKRKILKSNRKTKRNQKRGGAGADRTSPKKGTTSPRQARVNWGNLLKIREAQAAAKKRAEAKKQENK